MKILIISERWNYALTKKLCAVMFFFNSVQFNKGINLDYLIKLCHYSVY